MSDDARALRRVVREMQAKGWLRCSTYLGNLCRMHDLPFEEQPTAAGGTDYWVPAWLEWHMLRFKEGVMKDVPMRERIEQARALLEDKSAQLDLLCEAILAGGTLNDPDGDLSTQHAINLLKEELHA
jgi:hypothetical protein